MAESSKNVPILPTYYKGVFKAVAPVSRDALIERFGKECLQGEGDEASDEASLKIESSGDSVVVFRSPCFDYDMRLYQKTLAERDRIAKEEEGELTASSSPTLEAEIPTKSIFEREIELNEVELKALDDKITSTGNKVDRQTEEEYKQNMEAIRKQKKEKIERKLKAI